MRYICIEGCIGAGKTTLATLLSERLQSTILLENFEKHPFLDDFYSDIPTYAYETEIGFLLMHYHQIKKIFLSNVNTDVISDFYIGKDLLFAESNIVHEKELSIFKDLYEYLSSQLLKPNLIIYLKASNDLLLKRIKNRGRENEKNVDLDYISKLNAEYNNNYSKDIDGIKVLTIDMDKVDFLKDISALDELIEKINRFI